MKIKCINMPYEKAMAVTPEKHRKPRKPSRVLAAIVKLISAGELKDVNFSCTKIGMERLKKGEPCLILMNHSSFIDLKIASSLMYPNPMNIVCTSDGFVGKGWLLRGIGCIPTAKFTADYNLVRDMLYTVNTLKSSILMFPEASYSFDGTATPLPDSVGKCLKHLKVPLVMIKTHGAFLRDPLYNNLQLRKVDVTAEMKYVLSPEEIAQKSLEEINDILAELFTFDNFREQQQKGIKVTEPFRADSLNRVLYRCPTCLKEGMMEGKGKGLVCKNCGKAYELTEEGYLKAKEGETPFAHIPDWYAWQRECVKKEIEDGSYRLDVPVDICILRDTKSLFRVGEGRLVHTAEGFHLTGCKGQIDYKQLPSSSYSLYSDFFWYEIGDTVCIGKPNMLYYCFPKDGGDIVAKTRLATEEMYKIAVKKQHK